MLDTVEIKPLAQHPVVAETIAKLHRKIYPKEMQESEETIQSILASTDLSRGVYRGKDLVGYALFQSLQQKDTVYLYDIAIVPELQRKGLGTRLVQEIFRVARSRKLKIMLHVRYTAHALFRNPSKIREFGYEIVKDQFRPDWYFEEFGIHEDAHELALEPMGE